MAQQSTPHPSDRGRAEDVAAGTRGVLAAAGIALEQMGVARGVRALTSVNQQRGFDCPSCAWPDPDKRHTAEFCENGAKAVAWEATRLTVGEKFFAEHSLEHRLGELRILFNHRTYLLQKRNFQLLEFGFPILQYAIAGNETLLKLRTVQIRLSHLISLILGP